MHTFWISRRRDNRATYRPQRLRRQPLLEDLEGRQLLSTFNVTNNSDDTDPAGTGSLWQAIYDSNNAPGSTPNIINFEIPSGSLEIKVTTALPLITQPIVINGFTQSGTTAPTPGIELNGENVAGVGLELNTSGSTVEGLAIVNFTSDGVQINSASDDLITDNYIGLTTAGGNGSNGGNGVTIASSSTSNTIGGTISGAGNTISNNGENGVDIDDSSGTLVEKNRIGTDAGGNNAQSNLNDGIYITDGSSANTIGATTSGAYNVISGNEAYGVDIDDGSSNNVVEGNRIGTIAKGTGELYNSKSGVFITGSSTSITSGNTIGGTTASAGNLISGNVDVGVDIYGVGAQDNVVQQNLIGTELDGTKVLGNRGSGVLLHGGASYNTIAGNTISANEQNGVEIESGASNNTLEGNLIGTNSAGTGALPNTKDGVLVLGSTVTGGVSSNNVIGGTGANDGNTISGNGDEGVYIGIDSTGTLLEGNWIGTNTGGTGALHNYADGIIITGGSSGNTIGGTLTGATNTISGNWGYGVRMSSAASNTLVEGNFIGTDAAGSHSLSNGLDGVYIDSSSGNTIGGTVTGAGNTISHNKWDGLEITGNAKGNLVQGDVIDSNGAGGTTSDFKNGVYIDGSGAADNTIGGIAAGAGNTISGNVYNGVFLNNTGVKNLVEYDVIEHNGESGVYANHANSTTVINCTIEYNNWYGIWEIDSGNFVYKPNTAVSHNVKGNYKIES